MKKSLILNEKTIHYELLYKNVRNLNLRIKPDGSINVSANRQISQKTIDDFLMSRAEMIIKALTRYEARQAIVQEPYFSESEVRQVVLELCEKVYPYFESRGVRYPVIKFRKMISQWGNCRSDKGILTFNTNLMYATPECIEYVVIHEFTHFLQANHSQRFYDELSRACPDWKKRKAELKEIVLR